MRRAGALAVVDPSGTIRGTNLVRTSFRRFPAGDPIKVLSENR
jgi:hypothetical protein